MLASAPLRGSLPFSSSAGCPLTGTGWAKSIEFGRSADGLQGRRQACSRIRPGRGAAPARMRPLAPALSAHGFPNSMLFARSDVWRGTALGRGRWGAALLRIRRVKEDSEQMFHVKRSGCPLVV